MTDASQSRRETSALSVPLHYSALTKPGWFLVDFVVWNLALCLVFCPQRFVFIPFPFHFPTKDGFPLMLKPS